MRVLHELNQTPNVALTTDLWTSIAHKSYITVTAHFIDGELQMVARVLNTFQVPESTTSDHLADALKKVADDWQISGKISCVVTDNGSNVVKAVKEKLNWPHLPCFAHTLNLAYKDSIAEVIHLESLLKNVEN
jgi:hypothetical protein